MVAPSAGRDRSAGRGSRSTGRRLHAPDTRRWRAEGTHPVRAGPPRAAAGSMPQARRHLVAELHHVPHGAAASPAWSKIGKTSWNAAHSRRASRRERPLPGGGAPRPRRPRACRGPRADCPRGAATRSAARAPSTSRGSSAGSGRDTGRTGSRPTNNRGTRPPPPPCGSWAQSSGGGREKISLLDVSRHARRRYRLSPTSPPQAAGGPAELAAARRCRAPATPRRSPPPPRARPRTHHAVRERSIGLRMTPKSGLSGQRACSRAQAWLRLFDEDRARLPPHGTAAASSDGTWSAKMRQRPSSSARPRRGAGPGPPERHHRVAGRRFPPSASPRPGGRPPGPRPRSP